MGLLRFFGWRHRKHLKSKLCFQFFYLLVIFYVSVSEYFAFMLVC